MNEKEIILEMDIQRLKSFPRHPFHVEADQEMLQLKKSIENYGILTPLIVRPLPEGNYEIISGHRRRFAAEQLEYEKLPVIIRSMNDDEAVIYMVDSNLQREHISPSEKAHAYKMKYDVMKRHSGRPNGSQNGHHIQGKKTINVLGADFGDSPKQVQRYLKLTDLIPEMLERLDEGLISFGPAVEMAFLSEKEQEEMLDAMDYTQTTPSVSQAQRIKKLSQQGNLSPNKMKEILGEIKKGETERVIFKNEQLYKYFPRSYSAERMKQEILNILDSWMEHKWEE